MTLPLIEVRKPVRRIAFSIAVSVAAVLMLAAVPVEADDRGRHGKPSFAKEQRHHAGEHRQARGHRYAKPDGHRHERRHVRRDRHAHRSIVRNHAIFVPAKRLRHHRSVIVVRPYGHWHRGYGFHRHDRHAWRWLSFTTITVRLTDRLSEHQRRTHEAAQVRATTAPVGETILWRDGSAQGSVVAVREGTSNLGRYCREFQQTITVGSRTEHGYGTACRRPDGAWEVVSTGN